jgi:hypothetical protein
MKDELDRTLWVPHHIPAKNEGLLMITSFIIHYLGWQARNRFLCHLPEMATSAQMDGRCEMLPMAFLDPWAFLVTNPSLQIRARRRLDCCCRWLLYSLHASCSGPGSRRLMMTAPFQALIVSTRSEESTY